MAVSALAERRGQQANRARVRVSADASAMSFIKVAIFRSSEIIIVYGSCYDELCDIAPTVDAER